MAPDRPHLTVTLEEVALDLYGLPPSAFTAARDERAASARAADQRSLAAEIKKLRRPTTAAWMVNLLARRRPGDLEALLALGRSLREAQGRLDRRQLRQLSERRRAEVHRLTDTGQALAAEAGLEAGAAALAELEATLEAALADESAAEAVHSGRLTTALRYAGLGSVDLAGAADPAPGPAPEAAIARRTRDLEAARREIARAQATLRSAEQEVEAAKGRLGAARRRRDSASGALGQAEDALRRIEDPSSAPGPRGRPGRR